MSRKALKIVVELRFRAVSCPGVHLPAKDDIYLSVCFMGQYRQSEDLPAIFPLLVHEKMTFEKIFRHAVDPGDITVMLEYETVRIELVQLIPPAGDTLACFEEDARHFLFPEPRLVPSFSGVDREVLMSRAPHFPGIAPRLEFSTKTSIIECSANAEINIYRNVPMRPVIKRNRTSSPQRKQLQTIGRRRHGGMVRERHSSTTSLSHIARSQSLSPLSAENTQRLAQLSLDSAAPDTADWDATSTSQPMLASWPGTRRSALPHHSALVTSYSSPLTRSSSTVRFSPSGRRKSLSSGLIGGISDDSSSSETNDCHNGPEPSALWRSYREQARHSSSHREWEEVHERVRGLLTTPKAVRRLVYGATVSEIDSVFSRRSISPGPP
uniref:Spermatogenesis-associated protein 6 N-terminal domain-containing protein n=1 Tax=Monopterus albus TaxID=43700 RepID=A0A3Q3K7D1_MONAL|nr:spermatogenesis associated 6-like protein isoform X4 [Monopterus albus]